MNVKKWLILTLVLWVVCFFVKSPHAEVFKWVDGKGAVNYTDDPETIPPKYRNALLKVDIGQEALGKEGKKGEEVINGTRYTKDEFERLDLYKHRDQVIELVGEPDSISSPSGYIDEFWHYKSDLVYNPVRRKVYDDTQIKFKYFSKRDLESSSIPEIKDKYPRSDYYAVSIDYQK